MTTCIEQVCSRFVLVSCLWHPTVASLAAFHGGVLASGSHACWRRDVDEERGMAADVIDLIMRSGDLKNEPQREASE
jgi:hypothetical protein